MNKQTIAWTALPRTVDGTNEAGTKLGLSVYIAPRLRSDDAPPVNLALGDFPDFLDWPKLVGDATFEVTFEGGPTLPAKVVTKQPLRSDVWQALFHNDTLVVPFVFENFSDAELETFPSDVIHDAVQSIYVKYGTQGTGADLPDGDTLGDDPTLVDIADDFDPPRPPVVPPATLPDIPDIVPKVPVEPTEERPPKKPGCGCGCLMLPLALLRALLKRLGLLALLPFTMGGFGSGPRKPFGPERFAPDDGGGAPVPPPPMSPKKSAFQQLERFTSPTSKTAEPMPTAAELQTTYDFHQMVSTLGDYPNLLRYCGLVVDLEVTLDAAIANPSLVKIVPTLATAMATTHYSPRTHYELTDDRFVARSHPVTGELSGGLLRVHEPGRFRVLQLDVAGSGSKLQNTANKLVYFRKKLKTPANEPKQQGLPALQTAGLSLVRPGFAKQLAAHFKASQALNDKLAEVEGAPPVPGATDELWAENVLRGYRVDVFDDKSAKWRSLCRRVGQYAFAGGTALPDEEDEGFIETAATESVKKEATRVLRVHESLFTWNGWSLAAPRLGKTILPDFEEPDDATKIGTPPNSPATQFKMETSFKAKDRSLPRLRFGYSYRLRVRAVDLAGNSVFEPDQPAFDVTQTEVTPEVKFRRFEPVAPPMVMLQKIPIEGESLERLVVRSTFDDTVTPSTVDETNRHLIPPKTSQLMAEQHRKFDISPGGMSGDAAGYLKAARESGAVSDTEDPITHARVPLPGVVHVKHPEHEHWLQTNDQWDIPYLPDPYSRGVQLMGLPGVAAGAVIDGVNRLAFKGAWPDHKPFLIRVKGLAAGVAAAAPLWDDAKRILHVEIPKGETHEVRISSFFLPSDLENMAVWKWIADSGTPQLGVLRDSAEEGRTWMHLPFRTLTLVHAVQQPLMIPALGTVKPKDRAPGQTIATITSECDIDAKSTEKIDLYAAWSDPVDDPAQPLPGTLEQRMHVAQIQATNPALDKLPFQVDQPIGDTKHHLVTYRTDASTRFREYFPPAVTAIKGDIMRPAAGEAGPTEDARIRSSARPAAPGLQYIVPTFPWKKTSGGGTFKTRRRGGGLRVYLDRGWFSTGADELLGIVLRPPGVAIGSKEADKLSKYTSEWGMDPIWPATATKPLVKSDFVDRVDTGTDGDGVLLAEVDALVDVVGYKPEFDPVRRLWFCDILLDTGAAYFPMVKLALVRFQRYSVKGMHISPVVPADFIQVVPPRELAYDATKIDVDGTLTIDIHGPAYRFLQLELDGVPEMVARIEQRSANDAAGELGWEAIATHRIPPVTLKAEDTTWSATLTIPSRPTPMRVVVLELERYGMDDRTTPYDVLQVAQEAKLPEFGNMPAPDGTFREIPLGYRITFADAIEVS